MDVNNKQMSSYAIYKKHEAERIAQENMKIANTMVKIKPSTTNDVKSFIKNYSKHSKKFKNNI